MASAGPPTDAERKAVLLRAARAVRDWSLIDVAKRTGLSVSTIYAAEGRGRRTAATCDVSRILLLFEDTGIEFFDAEADGLGIRIRTL